MRVFSALASILLALSFSGAAHAAALMSPLNNDDCLDARYVWVEREHQCVEFSYSWMGEWSHVGSTYPDLKGPFPHRWSTSDSPHVIEIGGEHSVLVVRAKFQGPLQIVVWGVFDDAGDVEQRIGLVAGSGKMVTLVLVTKENAAKSKLLDPLRELGTFADDDTLVVVTEDMGTHFFRQDAAPIRPAVGLGRPDGSACYTMFDAPEQLNDYLIESVDQFEAHRPTLGDTIISARFEVLSGHHRYSDCLAEPDRCHQFHSLPRAIVEARANAPFLMTEGDEVRVLNDLGTLAELERGVAEEGAEIHAESVARIRDLEFIYDSVSVNGHEIMAKDLFDTDAKALHIKKVMESMFEQGVCFAAGQATGLGEVAALAGDLVSKACSA